MAPEPESSVTRLGRLVARDPVAQRALWMAERPGLVVLAVEVLGSRAAAEDLVDGALLDFLFHHVDQLRHEAALSSYLRLMTLRRAIRARRRSTREGSREPEERADPSAGPEAAELRLVLPKLAECLGGLRPKAREILRLRYQAELTQEEIGGLLGGSKQYIGRVLAQSLAALRECLEGRGGER